MAFKTRGVTLVVMSCLFVLQVSHAAVYKVGDSAGWTTIGNINYKEWSAPKTFQVGDTIIYSLVYVDGMPVFQYNAQFHNVMRVTHAMYKTCNASAPLATYTSGNDSIKITTRGHHYFFCGVPGHCQSGQKVDINVLRTREPAPAPAAALSSPPVPAAKVPGPSSSSTVSLKAFSCVLGKIGLTVVIFQFFS